MDAVRRLQSVRQNTGIHHRHRHNRRCRRFFRQWSVRNPLGDDAA